MKLTVVSIYGDELCLYFVKGIDILLIDSTNRGIFLYRYGYHHFMPLSYFLLLEDVLKYLFSGD